ncbi:hypothetical protein PRIC2_005043 [Phytophthora ramorum]
MASSDGWHCPICLGGFERPVLASCCGQSFCRPCLDAALRQVDACPMCRSPLLSGPFSVTPNRALEEALTALASASSPSAPVNEQDDRIAVAAGGNKLAVWERKFAPEAQIARQNLAQVGNGHVPLVRGEEELSLTGSTWRETWRVWKVRNVSSCRRRAASGRRRVSARSAELRRRLRQWLLWCRVNWASLQCVFYVLLFFVFVSFLRVQEEEFSESTNHLRRPH